MCFIYLLEHSCHINKLCIFVFFLVIDEETVQKQVSSFQQYRLGEGVDRIAGAEAIISKLLYVIYSFLHGCVYIYCLSMSVIMILFVI